MADEGTCVESIVVMQCMPFIDSLRSPTDVDPIYLGRVSHSCLAAAAVAGHPMSS
jgi:hypothetical protein